MRSKVGGWGRPGLVVIAHERSLESILSILTFADPPFTKIFTITITLTIILTTFAIIITNYIPTAIWEP